MAAAVSAQSRPRLCLGARDYGSPAHAWRNVVYRTISRMRCVKFGFQYLLWR